MIDIVIPLGNGSKWRNNELRYALRSIDKHLLNIRHVVIVGELPKWCTNVIHIPAKDKSGRKEYSIFSKIMAAVNDSRVSNPFIFSNDDIFFLKKISAYDMMFWYDNTLQHWHNKSSGHYKGAIGNVINEARHNNLYTDIHAPIVYLKERMQHIERNVDWSREYVVKSLYTSFNFFGDYQFEEMTDCKINASRTESEIKALIKNRLFFSVGDYGINASMRKILFELFPEKSKFEL